MTQRQLTVAGANHSGQCILPIAHSIDVPTLASLDWLDDDRLVLRAAGGGNFTLLLDDKAHVHAVGHNDCGELGRGHANNDDRRSTLILVAHSCFLQITLLKGSAQAGPAKELYHVPEPR